MFIDADYVKESNPVLSSEDVVGIWSDDDIIEACISEAHDLVVAELLINRDAKTIENWEEEENTPNIIKRWECFLAISILYRKTGVKGLDQVKIEVSKLWEEEANKLRVKILANQLHIDDYIPTYNEDEIRRNRVGKIPIVGYGKVTRHIEDR